MMGNVKKLMVISVFGLALSGCWTTKEGQKTGTIVKVSKEGFWWGTYEGELIRGGFDEGTGSIGKSFHFSLGQFKNSNVVFALDLMNKNKPVSIAYHCESFVAPWRGGSNCFLDKIIEHV